MSDYRGPSAFPSPDERDAMGCGIREGSPGMDLRDWFAGQALAGFAASPDEPLDIPKGATEADANDALREFWLNCARAAYVAADAMMVARSGGQS